MSWRVAVNPAHRFQHGVEATPCRAIGGVASTLMSYLAFGRPLALAGSSRIGLSARSTVSRSSCCRHAHVGVGQRHIGGLEPPRRRTRRPPGPAAGRGWWSRCRRRSAAASSFFSQASKRPGPAPSRSVISLAVCAANGRGPRAHRTSTALGAAPWPGGPSAAGAAARRASPELQFGTTGRTSAHGPARGGVQFVDADVQLDIGLDGRQLVGTGQSLCSASLAGRVLAPRIGSSGTLSRLA